jgi:hypothetical protein
LPKQRQVLFKSGAILRVFRTTQRIDLLFPHLVRRAGQGARILENRPLTPVENFRQGAGFESFSDRARLCVVAQESALTCAVMLDAIATPIEQADVNPDHFEQPFQERISPMMQHTFIKRHVRFERVRTQTMDLQNVVDITVRPGNSPVNIAQRFFPLLRA